MPDFDPKSLAQSWPLPANPRPIVTFGAGSIVAGGAFLKEGTVIPPNSIVMGSPGAVTKVRDNSVANAMNAFLYWRNAQAYAQGDYRLWSKDSFRAEMAAEHARLAAVFG